MDNDEEKSSKWVELGAVNMIVHFVGKEKMPCCIITYRFKTGGNSLTRWLGTYKESD